MFATWESMIDDLVAARNGSYASDPERIEARFEAVEYVVMTMLEKLRDQKIAEDLA